MDEVVDPIFVPKDPNKCGGLPTKLGISTGVRIMLRRNSNLANGLVKGAMEGVTDITWLMVNKEQIHDCQLPECVGVRFDDAGAHKIKAITIEFDGNKKVNIKRTMFPFILWWAVTVHKTQGITLEKALVDAGRKNFAHGQISLAISRVKTIVGLVLSDLDEKKCTKKSLVDPKVETEIRRLRNLRLQHGTNWEIRRNATIDEEEEVCLKRYLWALSSLLYII